MVEDFLLIPNVKINQSKIKIRGTLSIIRIVVAARRERELFLLSKEEQRFSWFHLKKMRPREVKSFIFNTKKYTLTYSNLLLFLSFLINHLASPQIYESVLQGGVGGFHHENCQFYSKRGWLENPNFDIFVGFFYFLVQKFPSFSKIRNSFCTCISRTNTDGCGSLLSSCQSLSSFHKVELNNN